MPDQGIAADYRAFMPDWLWQSLARRGGDAPQPAIARLDGAVLFADISGFSALTQRYAERGSSGIEQLTLKLSDYLGGMFALIRAAGGDLENFYGDGFLAAWPAAEGDLGAAVAAAESCAAAIVARFDDVEAEPGVRLRIRVAIVAGALFAVEAGGVDGRWAWFLAGECLDGLGPMLQATAAGCVSLSPAAAALRDRDRTRPVYVVPAVTAGEPLPADLQRFLSPPAQVALDPQRAAWSAEFRLLSVLCVGVGDLHCRDERDLDAIQRHVAAVQGALAATGGTVVRISMSEKGAQVLAAFGLPDAAHEDDPARARLAAARIAAASGGAARCVVAEGLAYCGLVGNDHYRTYTIMGPAVNKAAKEAAATTTGAAPGAEAAAPATSPRPSATALFGRDGELAWLGARLAEASDTRSLLVAVVGEPGIGKTALVSAFLRVAEANAIVARGSGDSLVGGAVPYAAWAPVFARLFAPDGRPVPEAAIRARLERQGLEAALAPLAAAVLPLSATGPAPDLTPEDTARLTQAVLAALLHDRLEGSVAAVVIEDTHWTDKASRDLAALLVTELRRLLIVFTSRQLASAPGAADGSPPVNTLVLLPVAATEVERIIAQALGCASVAGAVTAAVNGRAAGNPFFVSQLALSLREAGRLTVTGGHCRATDPAVDLATLALPDTVQRAVVARFDLLPADIRTTLKVASVVGPRFSIEAVTAASPLPPGGRSLVEQLGRVEEIGLARRSGAAGLYGFEHGVTQETIYGLLPYAQRRILHAGVARFYEERNSGPGRDAILGHHWSRAGEPERALPCWERAGYEAFGSGAYTEAVSTFREALGSAAALPAESVSTPRIANVHRHLGIAHLEIGAIGESRVHLVTALALLGKPWPEGRLRLMRTAAASMTAVAAAEIRPRAWPRGAPDEQQASLALTYESLGQTLGHSQEIQLMVLATARALVIARRGSENRVYSRAAGLLALALLLMRTPRLAARYFGHCLAERPPAAKPHDWLMSTEYLAMFNMTMARFADARRDLEGMLDIATRANNRRRLRDASSLFCLTLIATGKLAEAEIAVTRFVESAAKDRDPQVRCWSHLEVAELASMRGQPAGASLDEADSLLRGLGNNEGVWALGLRALDEWRSGRTEAALSAARKLVPLMREWRMVAFYAQGGVFAAAETHVAAIEADPAANDHDARAMMRLLGLYSLRLPICRPRGLVLLGRYWAALGRRGKAMRYLTAALADSAKQGRPYEEALARAALANVGPEEARPEHRTRAEAILVSLGAGALLRPAHPAELAVLRL